MNKNLKSRVTTVIITVPIVLTLLLVDSFTCDILFLSILLMCLNEYNTMFKINKTSKIITSILSVIVYWINNYMIEYNINNIYILSLFTPLIFISLISGLYMYDKVRDILISTLGIIYICIPMCLFKKMAYINMIYSPRIIIGILILIWTNDSLAYFGGTLLGKHKLCPNISPKKTIEGLVIGCLGVCGVSLLLGKCYPEWQNTKWILSGICIMIFGNIGDIFASSLKRCTDIKDSGTILPGHGGFLDRFDSLLFAVPFISVLDAFYPYSFLIVY